MLASARAVTGTASRSAAASRGDRLQPWIAVAASALLHLLLVLLALTSEPITMADPEGAAGGGRIEVEFIDAADDIPSPPEFPADLRNRPVPPRPVAVEPPDPSHLQVVEVERADEPLPVAAAPRPRPEAAPPAPPAPAQPRRHARGMPPGMLPEQHAPVNSGPAPSPAVATRGRARHPASDGPSMEAGGYHVVYDLMSEIRLGAWRDQGMTEIFLPLPGSRQYMVCPLETALRRGSGPCRLLEPDDPEMENIGDARKVITMERVYRRGELLWRGPAPYR